MKITNQLLRSRSARPLNAVEYLDLSNLELVSLERLELCPKLQTLNLRNNRIEAVSNLDFCSHLWKIDLANNKIKCLEGFCRFAAFGTIVLSNNNLDWNELRKIRHLHILDLALHGNPHLEQDAYYRMHVIDSLPLVWMLDGRLITSAERNQVEQFFRESGYSERPVRHKLPNRHFVPSSLKNIMVTGVFGKKTEHLMRRFPLKETLNIDMDNRRLCYLAYNLQQEVNLQRKYKNRTKMKPSQLIENLLNYHKEDQDRCNMLLLMLVATLEFAIPAAVVQQTLVVARLSKIGNIEAMELFLLPREDRCRVVSLLLAAVKIERDQNINGGLYNRLYLCLYDLVADLVKLANGENITTYQTERKKMDSRKSLHRSLLASEVVQLLCIVPMFFDFIGKDAGIMDLIGVATRDLDIGEKIKAVSWEAQSQGGSLMKVYQVVGDLLIRKMKESNPPVPLKYSGQHSSPSKNVTGSPKMQPSYIITSKKIVKGLNRPQSSVAAPSTRLSDKEGGTKQVRAATAIGVKTQERTGTTLGRERAKTAFVKNPVLGDKVQVGHQMFGRIAGIPESHIALVQLETFAGPKFQQADYQQLSSKQLDHQFVYVDLQKLQWSSNKRCWTSPRIRRVKSGKESQRNPKMFYDCVQEDFCYLSEVIRQNLQLRIEIPSAEKEDEPKSISPSLGKTVITDHVRSIVKECLEEAEVQWPNKDDGKTAQTQTAVPQLNENKSAWEEPQTSETLDQQSELTGNFDSESVNGALTTEDDAEDTSAKARMWYPNEGVAPERALESSFGLMATVVNKFINNDQGGEPRTFQIINDEEMVSITENARLDAWRTTEAITRASDSGVPSRIGSAATHQESRHPKNPPPQRPSTPTASVTVPVRQADKWLAGGKDINRMNIKYVSAPIPGWMEGLETTRRPMSSPAAAHGLRRRTGSSVGSPKWVTRPTTSKGARPTGGAARVYVSGRPPPSYIRTQSARYTPQRR